MRAGPLRDPDAPPGTLNHRDFSARARRGSAGRRSAGPGRPRRVGGRVTALRLAAELRLSAAYDADECQELIPLSTCHARTVSPQASLLPAGRRPVCARTNQGKRAGSRPRDPISSWVALARQHPIGRVQTTGVPGRAKSTGPRLDPVIPTSPGQPTANPRARCLPPRSTLVPCPNVARASTGSAEERTREGD